MTDRDKRKLIKSRLAYWQDRLRLQRWEISTVFKQKFTGDYKGYIAHVGRDHDYLTAKISFCLPKVSEGIVDETVIHELIHIICAEYDWAIEEFTVGLPAKLYEKIRENTVETLTRIILEREK